MLRTGIFFENNQAVLKTFDLTELEMEYNEVAENKIEAFIDNFQKPFNFEKPPLMRTCLVKVSPNRHYLVMDFHHIIADGYSVNIIARDFIQAFSGLEIFPPSFNYYDRIAIEKKYLLSESFKIDEQFWLRKFSGDLPQLDLPKDFSRPPEKNFQANTLLVKFSEESLLLLKDLAKEEETTLFIIMLTFYSLFFSMIYWLYF